MRVYGQSFEHWDRTLTFALWRKMLDDQLESPTSDDLNKWRYGYKAPLQVTKAPILPKLPEFED